MPTTLKLYESVTAISDSTGTVTFTFADPPLDETWTGTVVVPGAPSSAQWTVMVDAHPVTTGNGSQALGPVQAWSGQQVTLTGVGLLPQTSYSAIWTGAKTASAATPHVAPAVSPTTMPLPGSQQLLSVHEVIPGSNTVTTWGPLDVREFGAIAMSIAMGKTGNAASPTLWTFAWSESPSGPTVFSESWWQDAPGAFGGTAVPLVDTFEPMGAYLTITAQPTGANSPWLDLTLWAFPIGMAPPRPGVSHWAQSATIAASGNYQAWPISATAPVQVAGPGSIYVDAQQVPTPITLQAFNGTSYQQIAGVTGTVAFGAVTQPITVPRSTVQVVAYNLSSSTSATQLALTMGGR